MSKRALILHPAYWEQAMGGAELQIKFFVEFLVELGYEVHFIYEDKNSYGIENLLKINLHPIKDNGIKKTFGSRWIFYHKKINNLISQIKPEIIYTRFYSSWSGLAAKYAKENKIVHLFALASDSDLVKARKIPSLLKPFDWLEKKWMLIAFKEASYIITQNNLQQKMLKEFFSRKGVFFPQSTQVYNEGLINKSYEKIKICWIANLKPLKQPELFIELVKKISASNVEFIMIGRPEEHYRQLLKDAQGKYSNFKYLGELSNDEVNETLAKSHILINTSKYEGFSNTFVQAWMRKVVVISLNSNPDDILTSRKIGYLTKSIEEMQLVIDKFIKQPKLLIELGEKAYHYAAQFHSYEKNCNKLLQLIEKN